MGVYEGGDILALIKRYLNIMNPLLEYKPFRYGILSVLVLLSLFLLVSAWNGAFARGQFEPVNVITVEGTLQILLIAQEQLQAFIILVIVFLILRLNQK